MARRETRFRIAADGRLEVVDPGFDTLALLRSVDPRFRIRRAPLPGFTAPRFLQLRKSGCGLLLNELAGHPLDTLWRFHDKAMRQLTSSNGMSRNTGNDEASVLDLKIEVARRLLSSCELCGQKCGVNRLHGELGVCGLGDTATVAEHMVHIAEEPPINPSLIVSFAGCGLRCRYCQQWEILAFPRGNGELLGPSLWPNLKSRGARSISFVGGNPDESLYAILTFLAAAPSVWKLPVVWNSNGYGSLETVRLLAGVADAFIPDYKYGKEECGRELSQALNYPETAQTSISTMLCQRVPVIVRILVLPGHVDCCHLPAIDFLASIGRENLFVSVRDQYCPDWQITESDGPLSRRVTTEEIMAVRSYVQRKGLVIIKA